MRSKTIVITGASDGIGAAAARILHSQGLNVVVVGRTPKKTKAIAEEIDAKYYVADFAKLSDVRTLAVELLRDYKKIDVLVHNAGGIFGAREMTIDGHEKTMQVNYLAPFLLTSLLMDALVASKAIVINTSSVANKILSKFDIHDLEVENNYTANKAYGNAKLENILFTKELNVRYSSTGLSAVAFHPGNVATNFASNTTSPLRFLYRSFVGKLTLISPEQGADTLVWLATSVPNKDWQPGEYYVKRKVSDQVDPVVNDPDIAAQLWDWSLGII